MERKALGRGLEALLKPGSGGGPAADGQAVIKIPVDKVRPNRHQPRTRFTPDSLAELAESIKVHGLAQPLLVTTSAVPGEYELVAGERRLRAARMAGLVDVPCVVRQLTDRERHELSLIENIQREDLNPLEEAESMRKLMDEVGLTQEELARRLGKSRSALANRLRLLELPQMLRNALLEGLITEGHARALLGLADRTQQEELGKRVVQEKLTVRDVEKLVLDWASAARTGRVKTPRRKNADVRHLEEDLQRTLSRRVVIDARAKNKGWVRLEFYSLDDLDSLVARLKNRPPAS
ncbi:MAG: ParB/RepB/Spo0J family partition protein [Elusimicrobia bacterium]|jgi:ParB family chromosome partitioning protein|nr:ParB/RepB/Spo0J family partition protein [Elusimicrobiota bacterium]MBK7207691.1 ParB/RepB/Spo0J family partition protein [Elusimicrobiota bacterium]MBK7544452.1 ParB/RepB/Spo0J family partition protein [Elusimicrobiota bacterium]MBK7573975.1 ParB/RepB/Spo0J family partition protein [Elusimicrobiota bacterium]MBK7689076.1 ParB/RepB/Spo0J family partition protein [Elusimicrobiota bacterium]